MLFGDAVGEVVFEPEELSVLREGGIPPSPSIFNLALDALDADGRFKSGADGLAGLGNAGAFVVDFVDLDNAEPDDAGGLPLLTSESD